MQDHLTICLTTEEATVRAFLTTNGHTYVATYGPFKNDDIILNAWEPPAVNAKYGYTRVGQKVAVHTTAPS